MGRLDSSPGVPRSYTSKLDYSAFRHRRQISDHQKARAGKSSSMSSTGPHDLEILDLTGGEHGFCDSSADQDHPQRLIQPVSDGGRMRLDRLQDQGYSLSGAYDELSALRLEVTRQK